jgi:NAD(P)-dependent dehydrogenase (short-subunit alcohol dehydrogenase family)
MGKRAMEALAETVAKEERANHIRVNIIRPGVVETEMGRRLMRASRGIQNIKDMYATSPFGRVCQPSDIANVVAFLVSEKGEYISAATIKVSGG